MFRVKLTNFLTQQRLNPHTLLLDAINCNTLRFNVVPYSKPSHNLVQKYINTKYNTVDRNLIDSKNSTSNDLSEKEFLLKLKDDPDSFGTYTEELQDEGDLAEERHYTEQPATSQKLRTKQYADIIKDLIRKRKIKEAIDVVEVRMIKEDRVKPENYIYNLLLGACGRVGYTKKAFSLYNDMKKRGLNVTGGTYTSLFNACANSPWQEDCLTRATHLRNIMIEKMYEPNITNYNAMIKAFGRGGDLVTAFTIVDEMISKGIKIKDDTINFLLQSCITDKEAGFRHALLVWRRLVMRNIKPSVYTYNLMLRCIRDCGLGDLENAKDVIKNLTGNELSILSIESGRMYVESTDNEINKDGCTATNFDYSKVDNKSIDGSNLVDKSSDQVKDEAMLSTNKISKLNKKDVDVTEKHLVDDTQFENFRPNLMANHPHLGNIISLSEINKPEDKLLLVGGLKEFLKNMEEHKCQPDIKTFTLLLDAIPNTLTVENQLLSAMKDSKVKADLDFHNMLIKKRSMRFDYEGGKEVLRLIKKSGYKPDLITYGVLALGCKTKEEALELLKDMQEKNYRMNAEILGAMLHQATYHLNFEYVLELMEIALRENIKPNKAFMKCLDTFKKKVKYISNDKRHELYHSTKFRKEHEAFRTRYKTWFQLIEIDDSEDQHPWQQFRQPSETEKYKGKETRFKPVHKSLFRVKTSPKQKVKK